MNENIRVNNGTPIEGARINFSEQSDIDYWTKKLGVSEHDLRSAAQAVGSSVDKVAAKLKR
ncbi:MAG: hypothetical protein JWM78_413 [Verrucomicrobiaceae bacterium]|nr:hypothetical protein [Verrucomicrobiaceae bacterium]